MKQGDKNSLPNGWEMKTLGEVCDKASSNVSQNKLNNEKGIYPIYGASGFIKNVSFFHRERPYLSIVKDGSGVGRVTIMDAYSSVIGTLQYILPKENIELKYLYYSLISIDFSKYISGAAIPHIYFKDYANELLLWVPIEEQQRIVAKLDEAFEAIEKAKANAEQNLKNAKELFDSYLQAIFENKGKDWGKKTLQEVVDDRCTLSYGIVQPGADFPNGLPVVRPTDLSSKYIYLKGLKLIDPKFSESYKRTTLVGNELLLCVRGNTGVISIATKELYGANVTRGIVPICFNSKILNFDFGYYQFISSFIIKQIKSKTYGTALMQINIGDLRKILILIPSLSEQKSIVQKLDALSSETKKLEAFYRKKLEDLEELKKSILQKAFSGQL